VFAHPSVCVSFNPVEVQSISEQYERGTYVYFDFHLHNSTAAPPPTSPALQGRPLLAASLLGGAYSTVQYCICHTPQMLHIQPLHVPGSVLCSSSMSR